MYEIQRESLKISKYQGAKRKREKQVINCDKLNETQKRQLSLTRLTLFLCGSFEGSIHKMCAIPKGTHKSISFEKELKRDKKGKLEEETHK
jgi:hypothetical protein